MMGKQALHPRKMWRKILRSLFLSFSLSERTCDISFSISARISEVSERQKKTWEAKEMSSCAWPIENDSIQPVGEARDKTSSIDPVWQES